MVGGDDEVTRFRDPQINEDYDVQLRLEEGGSRRADGHRAAVDLAATTAELVRLDNLVSLERGQAPSRIDRLDRQREVTFRANVAPGYALGDRLEALRQARRRT